jgi:hypothetical protein
MTTFLAAPTYLFSLGRSIAGTLSLTDDSQNRRKPSSHDNRAVPVPLESETASGALRLIRFPSRYPFPEM